MTEFGEAPDRRRVDISPFVTILEQPLYLQTFSVQKGEKQWLTHVRIAERLLVIRDICAIPVETKQNAAFVALPRWMPSTCAKRRSRP
jgi:hypothetical protein